MDLGYFRKLFGDEPRCELEFAGDLECLVAIILSAQCTDKRVNAVTRELFKKYRNIADFANCDVRELERDIFSTGFYKNKAKSIVQMARAVMRDYGGVVPRDFESLIKLDGVGRKTAGVFLVERGAGGGDFFPVDTHVMRVAGRLGLSHGRNVREIERDLCREFAPNERGRAHLYLVLFGRYYCTARSPKCLGCGLRAGCLYGK